MKKFQFTLSKMLDYKDQILDREKNTLMQIRSQINAIAEKISSYEEEFDKVSLEMQTKSAKGITVLEIKGYDYRLESIRHQLKQLENEKKVLEQAAERQLKVVIAVSQEVSGLDKLQEKQLEEYNYDLAKSEELFISELVASNIIRENLAQ